ncbi:putative leucine-rich repeat receptor-like protein kinase [Panicum miliaceum]|uniref:non-specific serine/threonine protein kinase n=1 Tax=Panicum miliaceum TaxID=4540 RepID=A0A3L6RDR1_PANMI|nr:putative leucine-rich repeat receptor-like protein kinase [Panicum miliaceum]
MWGRLSTTQDVRIDDTFEAPSKVMQTAITPRDASKNIEFFWDYTWQPKDQPSLGYIPIMYFSEPVPLASNAVRQFYINIDGELWYKEGFTPYYLYSVAVYNTDPYGGSIRYNASINATANSTLPPIINAVELFTLISTANVGTDSQEEPAVSAITTIKTKYLVKKNWMGDPNMSFSGLNGGISSAFANLKAVQYVDLSHNNLTGSIPDALSQLPSLTVLYADNPNLCTDSNTCQTAKGKSMLAIYIAVPMALAVVIVLLFCLLLRRKKRESMNTFVRHRSKTSTSLAPTSDEHIHDSLRLENRRFTYKDLERITNNFQRVIGRGGFGYVYEGFLEDGTQVAVKLRSQSSNQGAKEFLTEAQILTRVHHKNLVSMIGYCKDGKYMALVYEYMSEGTLQEHIVGLNFDAPPLDVCMGGDHDVNSAWKAIEVALQGTAQASTQRPTMTDLVAQLQECLALEEGCTGGNTEGSGDPRFGYSVHVADRSADASQGSSAFEVEHSFGMGVGPATR